MTTLLDNYTHRLRFYIDDLSDKKHFNKFKKLKKHIEMSFSSNENFNDSILSDIKKHCILESNKNLNIIKEITCGPGLGEINNKSLRFRVNLWDKDYYYTGIYNSIIIDVYQSDNNKWTYEELNDIMRSFTIIATDYVNKEVVRGSIELLDNNACNEDYLWE